MKMESIQEAITVLDMCYEHISKHGGSFISLISKELGIDTDKFSTYEMRSMYQAASRQLVKKYGKPDKFWVKELSFLGSEYIPPREVKKFKAFMVKEGQTYKKMYFGESIKRASKIVGVGRWEGFTFQIICRQGKHVAFQDYCAHMAEIDAVFIDSHIACFYGDFNTVGKYGVGWKWLMENGPERIPNTKPMTYEEYRQRFDSKTLNKYMETVA